MTFLSEVVDVQPFLGNTWWHPLALLCTNVRDAPHEPFLDRLQCIRSALRSNRLRNSGSSEDELSHSVHLSEGIALVGLKRSEFPQHFEHVRCDCSVLQ